ncbi:peptidoglycan-binding protein [Asanoa ishikariensis]|uniref:Putative peptidoglycan binding domain-containing protein n=1 Tax=Asanoa ishikariensis TaxID=137265 RepID=A0A1H3S847_9ACTN|nr:peptidoglycan-binding domain-containing protein [Asanoa ishikariensis]GIF70337.1 peptidoglycan-binding protein [Asanoa ishikariensis]SDZ33900.1 Putative peptidoglycan binding domain-containing protein [Asanoa ishikariensis]
MARSKAAIVAVVVVALGVAAGAVLVLRGGAKGAEAGAPPPALATIKVTRTDLSDTQTLRGTLGFGPERVVKGAGTGIVTRLPRVGDTVGRGKPLYWVDDRPVPVLFGGTPLFRTIDKAGLTGSDVRVVADNLAALGYETGVKPAKDGKVVVGTKLLSAIKKWQESLGLEPTGKIGVGQAVVLPGPVRVSTVQALPGDEVAAELLAVTERTKLVTVPVGAGEANTVKVGAAVRVVLPDGKEIKARVASVSRTVKGGGSDGGTGEGAPPTVDILVAPDKAKDVAALDAAEVRVEFTSTTHKGVLAVPVDALVALREGGHALQLPGGALVAVETGMFARGLVEISGAGVAEGLEVVTAS